MRGWSSTIAFVLVAMLATATATHAAICRHAAISGAASDLQDARNALMVLPADKPSDAALAEMEMRISAFVLAYMRCQPETADIEGVEVDLARLGWASTAGGNGTVASANPGWQLTFSAESFGQGLIGVTATYSIPNGIDTVSMVFRHGDDGWAETGRHSGTVSPSVAPVSNPAPQ